MELENLVDLAKIGDKEALEEILIRFKPLLLKLSKATYIRGYENEDLIQTGYIDPLRFNERANQFIL